VIDIASHVDFTPIRVNAITILKAGVAALDPAYPAHTFRGTICDRAWVIAEPAMGEALSEIKSVVDYAITVFIITITCFDRSLIV